MAPPAARRRLGGRRCLFGFIAIVLVLRYLVIPHIADYRDDLARGLTAALNLPVAIGAIEADWQGLRPKLVLHRLEIRDAADRPALSFDNVEAVLAWNSLLYLEPRLHSIGVHAPVLNVRRDAGGKIFVAGLAVDTSDTRPGFGDWVLRQSHVIVNDATITWTDEMRDARPLSLGQVNFALDNSGSRHRFGVTAVPPGELATQSEPARRPAR